MDQRLLVAYIHWDVHLISGQMLLVILGTEFVVSFNWTIYILLRSMYL